jgi:hypothetical protein
MKDVQQLFTTKVIKDIEDRFIHHIRTYFFTNNQLSISILNQVHSTSSEMNLAMNQLIDEYAQVAIFQLQQYFTQYREKKLATASAMIAEDIFHQFSTNSYPSSHTSNSMNSTTSQNPCKEIFQRMIHESSQLQLQKLTTKFGSDPQQSAKIQEAHALYEKNVAMMTKAILLSKVTKNTTASSAGTSSVLK